MRAWAGLTEKTLQMKGYTNPLIKHASATFTLAIPPLRAFARIEGKHTV